MGVGSQQNMILCHGQLVDLCSADCRMSWSAVFRWSEVSVNVTLTACWASSVLPTETHQSTDRVGLCLQNKEQFTVFEYLNYFEVMKIYIGQKKNKHIFEATVLHYEYVSAACACRRTPLFNEGH